MSDLSVSFILGTRPEIIKLSPVVRLCRERDVEFTLVHTGQHYSKDLDQVFFDQLALPKPDYNLEIGSGPHGEQTAEMIAGIERVLLDERPDVVLVQGDTNSVLAGAIATDKVGADLGHVEAGLRSFDRRMPEESNRKIADHLSDFLFAPTDGARQNLREEGIPDERIFVTGNTVVDAVEQNGQLAERNSDVLEDLGVAEPYYLLTAHRAENVDDVDRFAGILRGVDRFADERETEVVYPVHPRAADSLAEFDLAVPDRIRTVEPQNYLDFLELERRADLVFTDSGGVQEEACLLDTPCVTVRESTERPETIDVGANCLAGIDPETIVERADEMVDLDGGWDNPFGEGNAANRILETLESAVEPWTEPQRTRTD